MKELTDALLPSLVTSFSQYAEENWGFMPSRSAHVPGERNKPAVKPEIGLVISLGNEARGRTGIGARDRSGSEARWMAGSDVSPFQGDLAWNQTGYQCSPQQEDPFGYGPAYPRTVHILLGVICQGALFLDAKVKTKEGNDLGHLMCRLRPLL